jgi:hypothetical protein
MQGELVAGGDRLDKRQPLLLGHRLLGFRIQHVAERCWRRLSLQRVGLPLELVGELQDVRPVGAIVEPIRKPSRSGGRFSLRLARCAHDLNPFIPEV